MKNINHILVPVDFGKVAANANRLTAREIRATWKGTKVHLGNRRLFEELTG